MNRSIIYEKSKAELFLLRKRLIACRNGLCPETGTFPEDLAALARTGFLLNDLMAGLVSPAQVKTKSGSAQPPVEPTASEEVIP